ncbi:hypothetical protein B7P43_G17741 [Cryptotermes secundus]|uniref:RING-type domain-containing protein n=1 Tax=Cryptotermes secundus TaxID=105785 RepID=A0A2J7RKE5_9NEOP|nr:hypothetical protein B7P43_G17741 [Cryptotermes secundus]
MEREEKQKSGGGSGITAGIICSVIGAAIGAFGYHIWNKKEEVKHSHSKPKNVYNDDGRCPICLSPFEELRVLPCGHQYHNACMNEGEKYNVSLIV